MAVPHRRLVLFALAAVAALLAGAPGVAQQAPTPAGDVTTVSPLTVRGIAPVPDVGTGATYFMPDELAASAQQAREDGIAARDDAKQCAGGFMSMKTEDRGDFDMEALSNTKGTAESALQKAALTAAAATQAALDARHALAIGQGSQASVDATELARQTAVKAYQAADATATEAGSRLSDLSYLASKLTGGDIGALRALESPYGYNPICRYDQNGVPLKDPNGRSLQQPPCPRTIHSPSAYEMSTFKAQVDDASQERSKGNGTIYAPEIYKDLRLADITAQQHDEDGVTATQVTGRIVNPGKQSVDIPPLWVSAVDKFGTQLASQQFEAPAHATLIPAGGSAPFAFVLKPTPDKVARTTVTFAPFHQTSGQLPITMFCPD